MDKDDRGIYKDNRKNRIKTWHRKGGVPNGRGGSICDCGSCKSAKKSRRYNNKKIILNMFIGIDDTCFSNSNKGR